MVSVSFPFLLFTAKPLSLFPSFLYVCPHSLIVRFNFFDAPLSEALVPRSSLLFVPLISLRKTCQPSQVTAASILSLNCIRAHLTVYLNLMLPVCSPAGLISILLLPSFRLRGL
ncbi:hypothetical protein F5Y10DRAFT_18851 [Nemania abortiva]|nr:hypothetical protein F5Y10DRAFT_18851 [Nemania abortiva]